MLQIQKFSVTDDVHVLQDFLSYKKGDIIPAGKLEKTKAISYWLAGKIKNVGSKIYTKSQLESLPFKELKEVGEIFGVTDRSKAKLVKEILAAQ